MLVLKTPDPQSLICRKVMSKPLLFVLTIFRGFAQVSNIQKLVFAIVFEEGNLLSVSGLKDTIIQSMRNYIIIFTTLFVYMKSPQGSLNFFMAMTPKLTQIRPRTPI